MLFLTLWKKICEGYNVKTKLENTNYGSSSLKDFLGWLKLEENKKLCECGVLFVVTLQALGLQLCWQWNLSYVFLKDSFIGDRRNTLFCRIFLNGCFGIRCKSLGLSAFTVIPVLHNCFYISVWFFKNVCIYFRRTSSRRRKLKQKLPEVQFK